jgi:hypothetical protein
VASTPFRSTIFLVRTIGGRFSSDALEVYANGARCSLRSEAGSLTILSQRGSAFQSYRQNNKFSTSIRRSHFQTPSQMNFTDPPGSKFLRSSICNKMWKCPNCGKPLELETDQRFISTGWHLLLYWMCPGCSYTHGIAFALSSREREDDIIDLVNTIDTSNTFDMIPSGVFAEIH